MTDRTRRPPNPWDKAEALFKPAAPKAPVPSAEKRALPATREMVTLRIDSDVLEHYQSQGPGWQDRINEVLRQASGVTGGNDDVGLRPAELNSSNDG